MTRPVTARAEVALRRVAPEVSTPALFALLGLALAGCATLGNPPAAEKDEPLYPTAQSNLTSLT